MRVEQTQIESLAGFRSALRRFLVFSEEATRTRGVTAQQYQAMLAIKARKGGEISMGDLAKELLLKPNGAVQMMDRLCKMGLAERRTPKSNLRSVNLSLTETGTALLLDLAELHLGQLNQRRKQWADVVRQLKGIRGM
jgi:DNA-binding MarR family transcriptional regulator